MFYTDKTTCIIQMNKEQCYSEGMLLFFSSANIGKIAKNTIWLNKQVCFVYNT